MNENHALLFFFSFPICVQRGNQLERIEGLEHLKSLKVLDLSQNRITSLSGLENLHVLGSINLEKNLVLKWESFQKEMCDVQTSASVLHANRLL